MTNMLEDTIRMPKRGLVLLLVLTAALTLINFGINGWGNQYYAAAAWAGTQSWHALLFGAFDPNAAVTVDKPPLSIWFTALSSRLFGFNTFALLVPQLVCSVLSVLLIYRAVRPTFGHRSALIAGSVLALTPVWVAVFRFNDPDSLLVTLVLAAICAAITLNRTGHARWAVLVGGMLGFAFMTKYLQAFLVLPALGLDYLLFGRPKLLARLWHLLLALIGLIVAGGWWLVIVALTPVTDRPYLGGSSNNTLTDLILGYNGFGRIAGGSGNATGSTTGISVLQPGILRLFGTDVGGHIAWLLPLALIVAGAGLMLLWGRRKTTTGFFEVLLWGGGLVVTALVLSFMNGIFHEYYTVALVPFIAALTGIGVALASDNWSKPWVRYTTAAGILITTILAWYLLGKSPSVAYLSWVVLLIGIITVVLLLTHHAKTYRRATAILLGISLLGGQIVYDLYTITTAQLASIPIAGPTVVYPFTTGVTHTVPDLVQVNAKPASRTVTGDTDLLYRLLKKDPSGRWVVAQTSGLSAANTELATRLPVLLIGGYNGKDPYPTLARFKELVRTGQVGHFYIGGDLRIFNDHTPTAAEQIQIWVAENYTPVKVNTGYLYDLKP